MKIEIVTEQVKVRDIINIYLHRYMEGWADGHRLKEGGTLGELRARLRALDPDKATPDDVRAALRPLKTNFITCDGCMKPASVAAEFDTDEGTKLEYCFDCMQNALNEMKEKMK